MHQENHIQLSRKLAGIYLAGLFFFRLVSDAGATTFYADSAGGSDGNTGTATNSAWKTLTKVNGTTFQPGDSILFKAGGDWTGSLHPKGSGATNNPIIIDMYGTGPKPIIDGNGLTGTGVVYLLNQSYWEINNLEIIDDAASGGDRRGIFLAAQNFGLLHHLYVRNCYIHNIKGIVDQSSNAAKRTGGYLLETGSDSAVATRFDDILVENCVIATVDNIGIALNNKISVSDYPGTDAWNARKFTHVAIRGNTIHDVAKNAMIIRLTDETGLIEHNVCYDTAFRALTGNTIFARSCRGTVFQFNEGYLNRSTDYDGSLYDADLQSPACIFQYSYSHDNNHGLFWMDTDAADTNVIVRYNISQNDKGNLFCMNYACKSAYVYNNTIYVGTNVSPTIINEGMNNAKTYYFYNNVILNFSTNADYQFFNLNGGSRTFDYNVFYGQHPASEPTGDAHKLATDPKLILPGSGETNDLNSVRGYRLQTGSPCIDSGMTIPSNGGRDYWGNAVPYNGATDRGASEWSGAAPIVSNQPTTSVTGGGATLNASINPGGQVTSYYFKFGTFTNYGNVTSTNMLAAGSVSVAGSNTISGLLPGTLYHYKVVATNIAGSGSGLDGTFTTVAISQLLLASPAQPNDVAFSFSFTNAPGIHFEVYTATNLASASNWAPLGSMMEGPAGQYQFTDPQTNNSVQRFYQVRWP
jgi:hypothetical protein